MLELLNWLANRTSVELAACYWLLLLGYCIFICMVLLLLGFFEAVIPEQFFLWVFKKMDMPTCETTKRRHPKRHLPQKCTMIERSKRYV